MILPEESRQLCQLFADILDYPAGSIRETAGECLKRLGLSFPDIEQTMQSFVEFIESRESGGLEELYAQTFDLTPATSLHLGFHLFNETPKRSAFMVQLAEAYQSHGFDNGTELVDHLCGLLRFLSIAEDPEFVVPLIQECILPVLEKIEKALQRDSNGYLPAVHSLRLFLHQVNQRLIKVGGLT
ncbi:MAG: molecular chaperone TorD family protein [Chloroflexi bacterium]|nr:molecular chaperone TorD family protein [Chloroflexota bacterium]